jgi:hypothetical protein
MHQHFESISPDFVQQVDTRVYPITRGLMIPFTPPLIYGLGGQIYFPWLSFWRANPLSNKRLAFFVSLVKEVLVEDPDLENARFQIYDFSAPKPKTPRDLAIIEARDVPTLSQDETKEMLAVFAEGFFNAQAELAGKVSTQKDADQQGSYEEQRQ